MFDDHITTTAQSGVLVMMVRGLQTSLIRDAKYSAMSGVCSAGLMTIVLPQHKAGPIFQAAISTGKFHGMIAPQTPIGSWRV